jgi:hypothetical protein
MFMLISSKPHAAGSGPQESRKGLLDGQCRAQKAARIYITIQAWKEMKYEERRRIRPSKHTILSYWPMKASKALLLYADLLGAQAEVKLKEV